MLSREEIKVIWESKKWEGEHYIDYIGFAEAIMDYDKPRELTDEEISQVYKEVSEPFGKKRLYEIHDFARAILKKASEK